MTLQEGESWCAGQVTMCPGQLEKQVGCTQHMAWIDLVGPPVPGKGFGQTETLCTVRACGQVRRAPHHPPHRP
jgi:hypothetical protein